MYKKNIFFLILFSIQLIFCNLKAQDEKTIDMFSATNRLKFGNKLYNEGDYLRAIYEFQDYLRLKNNDTVQFKIANAFHKMSRLSEAVDNYKTLFFDSELMPEAKLFCTKALLDKGEFDLARELSTSKYVFEDKYNLEFKRLYNISFLMDNYFLPVKKEFLESFPKNNRTILLSFYNRKLSPDYKSPLLAGILSAVIPGGGKFYTENFTDGLISFLSVGVLSYLAYHNFDADHKTRGWIFTGLASYFYAGNIYGSVASAHLYNNNIDVKYNIELRKLLEAVNYFLPELKFLK